MRHRVLVLAALVGALITGALPARADTAQHGVVSQSPVSFTPQVEDGTVYALALVGNTVVVGGSFSTVATADESTWYRRSHLFAYNLATGAVSSFAPALNGTVLALAAGPNSTVYAAGDFTTVDGSRQRSVVQLDLATGSRIAAFAPSVADGDVRGMALAGRWLYLGGAFSVVNGQSRAALARVDATTGQLDPAFDLHLQAPSGYTTKVEKLAASPDGSRLVAIGAFISAAGLRRAQLVMVDTATGTVDGWYTEAYDRNCYSAYQTYLRGVDFSPAGDYIVVVTTGKLVRAGLLCDSVARFETTGTGAHDPTWVNYTGGNSLFAVDATGPAVYVGGHQQWMNNPEGNKGAGPGAVPRPGIAAIDPVSGRALPWNPTRARGVGVQAFLSTPAGLLVGSDTVQLGHEYHARLGMFPPVP